MNDLQSIPILLTPNVAETAAFGRALGCDAEVFGEGYVILHGLGFELHYAFTEKPEVCLETSCYIRGGGMLALHPLLKSRAPDRVSDIFHREWGMTEFYLHDPHGNLWKFGMSTDELPDDVAQTRGESDAI